MRLFTNSLQYRYHVLPSSAKAVAAGARSRPRIATLLAFSAIYLLAVLFLRNHSYRDPTSWFFNPRTGYDRVYSDLRRQQASAFIEAASTQSPFIHVDQELSASSNKSLCLGIASIARENARYFRTAVGSLLDGLGLEERRDIHLVLFIAHTDPGVHPAYAEGWVQNVADRVLTYDLPEDKLNHVREMEKAEGDFREKGLFDYTYLLKACSDAGTPYVALLEDDVIAMDGWYHRTMDALGRAEEQSALMKASPDCMKLSNTGRVQQLTYFSSLSSTLLYRRVSRMEQRGMATVSLLVFASRPHPCSNYAHSPPLRAQPYREKLPIQRGHTGKLRCVHPAVDHPLLRRRQNHHAPSPPRSQPHEQLRLLLPRPCVPAPPSPGLDRVVRVEEDRVRRHAHRGVCE